MLKPSELPNPLSALPKESETKDHALKAVARQAKSASQIVNQDPAEVIDSRLATNFEPPLDSRLFEVQGSIAFPPESVHSHVIGVVGAKGGVGATTIAINIAAGLSARFENVTLVDANFQQPDIAVMLGDNPKHTLDSMFAKLDELDSELLSSYRTLLTAQIKNCYLLSPALNGEAVLKSNLSELSKCLNAIRAHSQCLVVDLPKSLDRHLLAVLDGLDAIVLVFDATVTGISGARRWLNTFFDLGYDHNKVCLVLNRSGSKAKLFEQELDQVVPKSSVYRIPNDFDLCQASIVKAVPACLMSPRSKYVKANTEITDYLFRYLTKRGEER
jgi:pilus assembly protein CpaE